MPTTDAIWNVFYVPPASVVPYHPELYIAYNNEYSTAGDTLINGEIWTKIVLESSSTVLHHKGTLDYQGAYIETDKVVRFCSPNGTITTLYDFNLQVGDSVKFLHFEEVDDPYIWIQDTCLIVKQIDSILIHNHYRRCITFKPIHTGDERYLEEKWIERIGSIHGILFSLNIRPLVEEANEVEKLTCFFENNELLWGSYNTCKVLQVKERYTIEKIEVYPNPAKNVLHIENIENVNIHTISILNIQGQTIKQYEPKLLQLNIADIPAGLYFIKFSTNYGKIIQKVVIKK
jgi:hypothetical protein